MYEGTQPATEWSPCSLGEKFLELLLSHLRENIANPQGSEALGISRTGESIAEN